MGLTRVAIIGISFSFVVGSSPQVMASPLSPPEPGSPIEALDQATSDGQPHELGFYGGATIGRGSLDISCDNCPARPALSDALSLSAFAGFRLLPRIGVFGEYWLTRWSDRSGPWFGDSQIHDLTQQTISAGAQVWVTGRLWLRAQLGVGRHDSDYNYANLPSASFAAAGERMDPADDRSYGAASALAAGFEWARTRTFAATIELRAARTRPDSQSREVTTGSLSIGAAWY